MEKTNILTLVITLVVGIILAGSILMPVIGDATKSISGVEYNEPTDNPIRMNYGTPSDNLKVEKPAGEALINMYLGESETPYYTFPLNTSGYVAWALVTSTFSYGITGGGSNSLIDFTARNTDETGALGNRYGLATAFTVNLNVTTGVISVDLDGNTYSMYAPCDVERIYWADPNGDYVNVVTRGNHPPIYLENPKDIIGSLGIASNYVFWQDTDNVEVTNDMPATITTTTTQENGLYVLDKISYELTGSDTIVRTGEMGHCIVKYQVVGNTVSGSDAVISLIQTLPILVIVALIVASIGAIYIKRND